MVSKQTIPVIGLSLTVYGLEEYNNLPKDTPVSVMFALHGRLENQSFMEPISLELCKLNESRKAGASHLIVISFDLPNHGTRLVHKEANRSWIEGKYKNPNHALDLWGLAYKCSGEVSELIDVIEHYIFGPRPTSIVRTWGIIGYSLGGHAAFLAAANDPRITVAIPFSTMADYLTLMIDRLHEHNLPVDQYLPKPFYDHVSQRCLGFEERLKTTHLFMINTAEDQLVKPKYNKKFLEVFRKTHVGKEGYDWNYKCIPGLGHVRCPEMTKYSVEWTYRWMIQPELSKL